MHLRLFDYVLWLAAPVILAGVVVAMYKRRLHRAYPYFFVYALFQVVQAPLLLVLYMRSYKVYYYAYYATVAVSVVVSVAVFWDIFKNALGLYEHLGKLANTVFWWSVVVVAGLVVLMHPNSYLSQEGWYGSWIHSGVSASRVAQCALILLLFFFRKYLGISRGNVVFGIALGFGLFAAVNMVVFGEWRHHYDMARALSRVNSLTYLVATLIWLAYALRGSTQPDVDQEPRFPVFPRSRAILTSLK